MAAGPFAMRCAAKRTSRVLDPLIRRRVLEALGNLAKNPNDRSLRKLKGRPESRMRVGDWRVLLELDSAVRTIFVKRVLPRGRAYDR
jgi:mRNA interferase RelE/StbE